MTEQEIFRHLFSIADQSHDTDGVVTSCLVRENEILADAVSAGTIHAEYALLQKLKIQQILLKDGDTVYVTVQPCSQRSSDKGKQLGDCTTNLIKAGIRRVIYAAAYSKSSLAHQRFQEAGFSLTQVKDEKIIDDAVQLFNSTCEDPRDHLVRK